jgi:hypothetical protein
MVKPWKKATAAAKTKTLKAPAKKQRPAKMQTRKRKPEDNPTDSDEPETSDTEPAPKPCKKHEKQTAGDETDVVDDRPDVEPELVSGGDGDDI